jgi:hypothetical protein
VFGLDATVNQVTALASFFFSSTLPSSSSGSSSSNDSSVDIDPQRRRRRLQQQQQEEEEEEKHTQPILASVETLMQLLTPAGRLELVSALTGQRGGDGDSAAAEALRVQQAGTSFVQLHPHELAFVGLVLAGSYVGTVKNILATLMQVVHRLLHVDDDKGQIERIAQHREWTKFLAYLARVWIHPLRNYHARAYQLMQRIDGISTQSTLDVDEAVALLLDGHPHLDVEAQKRDLVALSALFSRAAQLLRTMLKQPNKTPLATEMKAALLNNCFRYAATSNSTGATGSNTSDSTAGSDTSTAGATAAAAATTEDLGASALESAASLLEAFDTVEVWQEVVTHYHSYNDNKAAASAAAAAAAEGDEDEDEEGDSTSAGSYTIWQELFVDKVFGTSVPALGASERADLLALLFPFQNPRRAQRVQERYRANPAAKLPRLLDTSLRTIALEQIVTQDMAVTASSIITLGRSWIVTDTAADAMPVTTLISEAVEALREAILRRQQRIAFSEVSLVYAYLDQMAQLAWSSSDKEDLTLPNHRLYEKFYWRVDKTLPAPESAEELASRLRKIEQYNKAIQRLQEDLAPWRAAMVKHWLGKGKIKKKLMLELIDRITTHPAFDRLLPAIEDVLQEEEAYLEHVAGNDEPVWRLLKAGMPSVLATQTDVWKIVIKSDDRAIGNVATTTKMMTTTTVIGGQDKQSSHLMSNIDSRTSRLGGVTSSAATAAPTIITTRQGELPRHVSARSLAHDARRSRHEDSSRVYDRIYTAFRELIIRNINKLAEDGRVVNPYHQWKIKESAFTMRPPDIKRRDRIMYGILHFQTEKRDSIIHTEELKSIRNLIVSEEQLLYKPDELLQYLEGVSNIPTPSLTKDNKAEIMFAITLVVHLTTLFALHVHVDIMPIIKNPDLNNGKELSHWITEGLKNTTKEYPDILSKLSYEKLKNYVDPTSSPLVRPGDFGDIEDTFAYSLVLVRLARKLHADWCYKWSLGSYKRLDYFLDSPQGMAFAKAAYGLLTALPFSYIWKLWESSNSGGGGSGGSGGGSGGGGSDNTSQTCILPDTYKKLPHLNIDENTIKLLEAHPNGNDQLDHLFRKSDLSDYRVVGKILASQLDADDTNATIESLKSMLYEKDLAEIAKEIPKGPSSDSGPIAYWQNFAQFITKAETLERFKNNPEIPDPCKSKDLEDVITKITQPTVKFKANEEHDWISLFKDMARDIESRYQRLLRFLQGPAETVTSSSPAETPSVQPPMPALPSVEPPGFWSPFEDYDKYSNVLGLEKPTDLNSLKWREFSTYVKLFIQSASGLPFFGLLRWNDSVLHFFFQLAGTILMPPGYSTVLGDSYTLLEFFIKKFNSSENLETPSRSDSYEGLSHEELLSAILPEERSWKKVIFINIVIQVVDRSLFPRAAMLVAVPTLGLLLYYLGYTILGDNTPQILTQGIYILLFLLMSVIVRWPVHALWKDVPQLHQITRDWPSKRRRVEKPLEITFGKRVDKSGETTTSQEGDKPERERERETSSSEK